MQSGFIRLTKDCFVSIGSPIIWMMNIIVIGAGYVGPVAACCLANSGHQVTMYELNSGGLQGEW